MKKTINEQFIEAVLEYKEKLTEKQALEAALTWLGDGLWDYMGESIRGIEGDYMKKQFIGLVNSVKRKRVKT